MKKFFSLVLALVMALSLTTVAWGATTVVGLPADEADGNDDGFITLTADATITLTAGGILEDAVVVDGADVEIKADSAVTITATVADAFEAKNGGTLILGENVTITSSIGAVLYPNGGTITVDGTTIEVDYTQAATGVAIYDLAAVRNGGVLNMEDGLLSAFGANSNTVSVKNAGSTVNMNGGEVYSGDASAIAIAAADGGIINITDGIISTDASSPFAAVFGYSGTINVSGGTMTAPNSLAVVASNAATANVSGGNVQSVGVVNAGGTVSVTGGTFSVLPDEDYLADGYILVGNSVEKSSKKTNTYDGLYAKSTNDTSDNDPVAVDVVVTPAKAVKYNKTTGALEEAGYVEHVNITGDPTDYVFVNSLKEADVVLYKDAEGKFVKFYLDAIETPDYVEAVAFKNFGDDCGEVDYDEDDGYDKALKYFTIKGVEEFVLLEEAEEYACDFYVMYNSKLVPVVALGLDKVEHKVVTESEDGELVKVYCSACGTQAVKAPNMMSVPKNAELVDGTGTEIWYWPVVGGSVSTDTKVESAATFDAGIAMYVGMSVLAATSSAVVIGKKKD